MNWTPDPNAERMRKTYKESQGGEYMDKARAAEILGVPEDADKPHIRGRYAILVTRDHPDHGGDGGMIEMLKLARDCLLSCDGVSKKACPMCKGLGNVPSSYGATKCTACNGEGEV